MLPVISSPGVKAEQAQTRPDVSSHQAQDSTFFMTFFSSHSFTIILPIPGVKLTIFQQNGYNKSF